MRVLDFFKISSIIEYMTSRFFQGFRHAGRGLRHLLREEPNFRFQVVVAIFLLAAIMFLDLTYVEVNFLIVGIILVLGSEAINTVIERIMDSITTKHTRWIAHVKDMMASVVLLNCLGALVIGAITLAHYAMRVMGVAYAGDLDASVFFLLNAWAGQTALGDTIITFFAETSGFVLLFIFLFAIVRSRISAKQKTHRIIVGIVSMFVSRYIVTEIIRSLHPTPRPFVLYHAHQLIAEHGNSFPSGHAAFFFALSASVFFWNKRLGMILFGASIVMGIARVIAGVHYPSDIIAGMIVGVTSAWLVTRALSIYEKK